MRELVARLVQAGGWSGFLPAAVPGRPAPCPGFCPSVVGGRVGTRRGARGHRGSPCLRAAADAEKEQAGDRQGTHLAGRGHTPVTPGLS